MSDLIPRFRISDPTEKLTQDLNEVGAVIAGLGLHDVALRTAGFERRMEEMNRTLRLPFEQSGLSVEGLDADVALDPAEYSRLAAGVTLTLENTSTAPAGGVALALNAGLAVSSLTSRSRPKKLSVSPLSNARSPL